MKIKTAILALLPLLCNSIGVQSSSILDKTATFLGVDQGLKHNSTGTPLHHVNPDLSCGTTNQVNAHTDKYEDCPATCPYFAQNRKDTEHCTFVCVPGSQCGSWNANKPIPDKIKNSMTCRGPRASFCVEPDLRGVDICAKCQWGFALHSENGGCYFKYWNVLIVTCVIVLVLVTIITAWLVDFCCRDPVNDHEFTKAQDFRSRSKIMCPRHESETGRRELYPLNTNLCRTVVAGPGMLLHFRFQAAMIFYPLVVALIWTGLACFHNELFFLGTRKFGTPRHNCILVAWGYETQQRLMWAKVLFLAIVYVFSCVYFLLFSVSQFRIYQALDDKQKTMKDFALELRGLPGLPAVPPEKDSPSVEDDIKTQVQDAVNAVIAPARVSVVGVSVAWVFSDVQDEIMEACQQDLLEQANALDKSPETLDPAIPDPTERMGPVRKQLYKWEKAQLADEEEKEQKNIKEILTSMQSSESAFVVFNSEEDKDKALEVFNDKSFKFDARKYGKGESTCTFENLACEPATINWHNFGDSSTSAMMKRFMKGFVCVYLPALAIWFFVFYVPYAWSLYNFNYDNGAELPGYYSILFTIIVVGGNATMYFVCDLCCDIIGFRYKDTKQKTYMLMYLFACMFNVFLDLLVTYYTALKIMVGLDFRTYDGTRLSEIGTFTEQFETYAMQRSLAENTYRYAWPSTFLVPFLIEPFITVLIPYQIGKAIIRTHSEIKGLTAEAYLAAFEFDLGRYADILLNIFLGILIFYFPGGYTWSLFYGMFISHIVIYVFDHWRVLNVIPSVTIVSTTVDWWAQVMLVGCCAMIMSVLVFKANCESYSGYCFQDMKLIEMCTLAGIAHFIVHMLLLVYLVPWLGGVGAKEEPKLPEDVETYKECAQSLAYSWFSVNPVHCLRSKYIHEDKPTHCHYATWGKEHLMEVNEKINCFFSTEAADTEEYSADALRKSFTGDALRKSFAGLAYGSKSDGKL